MLFVTPETQMKMGAGLMTISSIVGAVDQGERVFHGAFNANLMNPDYLLNHDPLFGAALIGFVWGLGLLASGAAEKSLLDRRYNRQPNYMRGRLPRGWGR